jgi:hypothetical protein
VADALVLRTRYDNSVEEPGGAVSHCPLRKEDARSEEEASGPVDDGLEESRGSTMGRRRDREGRGDKKTSITLTVTFLATLLVGIILALGGAALAILTGMGILKYSGPATKLSGTFDLLGIDLGATITQIGVGIVMCLIGVAMLLVLIYVLTKKLNRDLLDDYLLFQ